MLSSLPHFMSWDVNSSTKDNFNRVRHIKFNSIFNYDLISICETSLNDSVELPQTLHNEYTFAPANNPANTRHGVVGLFYKNELLVVALKFGKNVFLLFYIEVLHLIIILLSLLVKF